MGPALAKGVHKWPNKYINEKKALLAKNRRPFPKLNWSDNPRPVQAVLAAHPRMYQLSNQYSGSMIPVKLSGSFAQT